MCRQVEDQPAGASRVALREHLRQRAAGGSAQADPHLPFVRSWRHAGWNWGDAWHGGPLKKGHRENSPFDPTPPYEGSNPWSH